MTSESPRQKCCMHVRTVLRRKKLLWANVVPETNIHVGEDIFAVRNTAKSAPEEVFFLSSRCINSK